MVCSSFNSVIAIATFALTLLGKLPTHSSAIERARNTCCQGASPLCHREAFGLLIGNCSTCGRTHYILEDDRLDLSCVSCGGHFETKYEWELLSSPYPDAASSFESIKTNSTNDSSLFHIAKVSPNDTGIYRCNSATGNRSNKTVVVCEHPRNLLEYSLEATENRLTLTYTTVFRLWLSAQNDGRCRYRLGDEMRVKSLFRQPEMITPKDCNPSAQNCTYAWRGIEMATLAHSFTASAYVQVLTARQNELLRKVEIEFLSGVQVWKHCTPYFRPMVLPKLTNVSSSSVTFMIPLDELPRKYNRDCVSQAYAVEESGGRVPPDADNIKEQFLNEDDAITVNGLRPYTKYSIGLRYKCINGAYWSEWFSFSSETKASPPEFAKSTALGGYMLNVGTTENGEPPTDTLTLFLEPLPSELRNGDEFAYVASYAQQTKQSTFPQLKFDRRSANDVELVVQYANSAGTSSVRRMLVGNYALNNVCVKQHPSEHLISQIRWTKPESPNVGHVLIFRCFARSWLNCSSGVSTQRAASELEVADVSVSDVQRLMEKRVVFAASACDSAGRCGPMASAEQCKGEYPISEPQTASDGSLKVTLYAVLVIFVVSIVSALIAFAIISRRNRRRLHRTIITTRPLPPIPSVYPESPYHECDLDQEEFDSIDAHSHERNESTSVNGSAQNYHARAVSSNRSEPTYEQIAGDEGDVYVPLSEGYSEPRMAQQLHPLLLDNSRAVHQPNSVASSES